MNRLLLASSRPKRLNNLKAAFLILSLFTLFLVAINRGVSTVHASSGTEFSDIYLNSLIFNVGKLNAQRTFPPKVVTIITKNETVKKLVFGKTASDIVREIGMDIDFDDMVLPPDEVVSDGGVVQVVKVDVELIKKSEDVPFTTKEVTSEALNTGALEIKQEGVMGVKEKTIKIIHQDGKVVKSEIISTAVLLEPIEEILLVGIKPVTIQDCNYWDAVINRLVPADANSTKNNWMRYIMRAETWCDSGQNTNNKYLGLYQFLKSTYIGNGGTNIWDGTEQIKVVSKMYDNCQQWQWGPYRKGSSRVVSFKDKYPSQYQEIERSCGR